MEVIITPENVTMALSPKQWELTDYQLSSLIEFINENNQYNDEEETIDHWDEIAYKLMQQWDYRYADEREDTFESNMENFITRYANQKGYTTKECYTPIKVH